MIDWGQVGAERLRELAALSEPGPGVTRLPFTPQHRATIDRLKGWMHRAGLNVHLDAAGTLVGRAEGPEGTGTFYLGSHQDSVRQGGAYDGIMGVVLPLLALEKLRASDVRLGFAVEVLAFADEEGVRFPTALIGSRALAGTFDPAVLKMLDQNGVSLQDSMIGFGLDPSKIEDLQRPRQQALGYLEAHIEQGPILEQADQALGVVSAICGIERHSITLTGETGHAGTLPMQGRKDALVGAAQIIAEVSRLAHATPNLRGTTGEIHIQPNVVNAVPREVRLTVELRSPDDDLRETAGRTVQVFAKKVALQLGLVAQVERTYAQPAQQCDPYLTTLLRQAVVDTGATGMAVPSGATHDASAMADLCPISMLFVRCRDGVSHSADEYAAPRDLADGVNAIAGFLAGFSTGRV